MPRSSTQCTLHTHSWPRALQAAIALMITGAVTAGATDLSYSLPGYVYVGICAVSTAVYLILIRFIRERTGATPQALCGIP